MEIRGSQVRQPLSETDLSIQGSNKGMQTLLLFNSTSRKFEIWQKNDTFAGYVVVAYRTGYEFCHEASDAECAELGDNDRIRMGSRLVDIGKGKTWQECEDAIRAVMEGAK